MTVACVYGGTSHLHHIHTPPDAKRTGHTSINYTTSTMPASYLSRHRPLCDVLDEIRTLALMRNDTHTVTLCDEAIDYARRMSNKLQEYKDKNAASS